MEERDENDDPEIACAEAMRYIISELLFASPTQSWRFYGYSTLWSLAETEAGLECMKSLEDRGGVATVFAQQYDCRLVIQRIIYRKERCIKMAKMLALLVRIEHVFAH